LTFRLLLGEWSSCDPLGQLKLSPRRRGRSEYCQTSGNFHIPLRLISAATIQGPFTLTLDLRTAPFFCLKVGKPDPLETVPLPSHPPSYFPAVFGAPWDSTSNLIPAELVGIPGCSPRTFSADELTGRRSFIQGLVNFNYTPASPPRAPFSSTSFLDPTS